MKNKAFFFDRDGVLINEVYSNNTTEPGSIHSISELIFTSQIKELCKVLKEKFLLIMFTNQPDIAKGKVSLKKVESINNFIKKDLELNDIYMCVCDNNNCNYRKPNAGMIIKAQKEWNIDLKRSFVVGDRWKDIRAGESAKCKTILLKKKYSKLERCKPDYIIQNVSEIKKLII